MIPEVKPVPALGGDIYPALGGDYPGNFAYSSLQSLASNVIGITVLLSGHWNPEEQSKFVIDQHFKFFGNSTNNSKGTLSLQVQMSIDGCIAGPNGEIDRPVWNMDDKLKKYVNKLSESIDTILLGRKMTDGFILYWLDVVSKHDDP